MTIKHVALIKKHQDALNDVATEKSKQWWERYMKGVIDFRGVGIPKNRDLLFAWRQENHLEDWPLEQQFELALRFFEEPMAEDKLAGILYLENFLYDKLPWNTMLARYEALYAQELIFDWNICDCFCVRVLGPTIEKNGIECAEAVASWKDAPYLWQARSAVAPFVNLVSEVQYYPYIKEASEALIVREERFAKTAVGWVLRQISKVDEGYVLAFVNEHLESFSSESLRNALKYFPEAQRKDYLQALKAKR